MARTRLLKPGFFTNADLARLSERHRLLFAGLWTIADRNGRLKDDPARIRAELFPYEPGINVDALLADLHRTGFIHRYKANLESTRLSTGESKISTGEGQISTVKAIVITKFTVHQKPHIREQNGDIPPPPAPTKVGAVHPPRRPVSNTVSVSKDKSSGADAPRHTPTNDRTDELAANVGIITKIAHEMIDLLGESSPDLVETVKGMCAHRKIAYDSTVVHKAIESARVQRKRAMAT